MAYMTQYDPFGAMVDDFLKGFLVKPVAQDASDTVRRMRIDLTEHNGAYRLLAELPGVKKEDIQVVIDGNQVSISAEGRQEAAKEGERLLHSERRFGKWGRAFRLGEEVDETKVEAKFADGVLELTLPKKAPSSRQITIQ